MPAGDLVVTGARRGAVGPVQTCRTADRAVVTLHTMNRQKDTEVNGKRSRKLKKKRQRAHSLITKQCI